MPSINFIKYCLYCRCGWAPDKPGMIMPKIKRKIKDQKDFHRHILLELNFPDNTPPPLIRHIYIRMCNFSKLNQKEKKLLINLRCLNILCRYLVFYNIFYKKKVL